MNLSQCMLVAILTLGVTSCASKSADIAPSYVSPIIYENMTCDQLAREATAISSRAAIATGQQDKKRTQDAVATTAAIILFWPAAFLVGGDGQNAAELARLKGSMEALETAANQKSCGIQFQGTS